ncbi:interleukin-21 receptor-like [Lepisosteus oculatus]|uniref:interleukin-21 receptor-like n=1 Tax=Lepisosteus oculatus TaxID=7918 RepID=UPI00073FC3BD|nr:PREDICTED: interleukin-21 receptor-like isoform X2 [Lepisosteus oculatus]XP_015215544.1 PREDICTED: interleukin-21 receptor-like isoform X2 [Lepisosteus oculatus]XP_015215545.1 PREDICTED: interleukin-21 receptor-like isoform X2 [Lepisosteus oculatus]
MLWARSMPFLLWAIYSSTLLTGSSGSNGNDVNLICVNDYRVTVTCTLEVNASHSSTENATYSVEFFSKLEGSMFTCAFKKVMDSYKCTLDVDETFSDVDCYGVTLRHNLAGQLQSTVYEDCYEPELNIQPFPPQDLTVTSASQQYLFTWAGSKYKVYTDYNVLHHELWFYKKENPSMTRTVLHTDAASFIYLNEEVLEPDTVYVAKLRAGPENSYYKGHWSKWSSEVEWRTNSSLDDNPSDRKGNLAVIWQIALSLAAVAVIASCLYCTLPARIWIKSCTSVPTPAPFFQPLYSHYKGDFQKWLLSQGLQGDLIKMEEVLKIDMLIDAKPIKKEESCFLAEPSETICQVTYVNPHCKDKNTLVMWNDDSMHNQAEVLSDNTGSGSPLFLKASFDEMFSSLSLDSSGMMECDSGCEDPTQSLDSSWPHTTLSFEVSTEPESLCYSDDYCTLSDTHNGLVPTRVVKQPSKIMEPDAENPPEMELSKGSDHDCHLQDSPSESDVDSLCQRSL